MTLRTKVQAGALATFALVFAYRWQTVSFTNDQFAHLSRARQILLGDVPVRDFFDPGLFLKYYLSAAALSLSGGTLLGEALLTIFFIALGAALLYVMATRLSGSWLIGAAATATAAAAFPRLYNYPKVFLFVLAVACAWRYQVRRTSANLALIAVVTAVAFLIRHDHSAHTGIAVLTFLGLLHWPGSAAGVRQLASAVGVYTGLALLLVLPFLVFIQSVVGIPHYVVGLTSAAREITTLRLNAPPVQFDWAAPLVRIDPPSEPRFHVRWDDAISDGMRRERERRYRLASPIHDESTTWSYAITDAGPPNIATLLADPLVDDTNGIDRVRGVVDLKEGLFRRAQRRIPVLRMQIAPGVLTFGNALAWLYYASLALPVIALATLVSRRANAQEKTDAAGERAIVGMLIVLCVVISQSLVRDAPEVRLPDVAAPMALLAAWVAGTWTRGHTLRGRAGIAAVLALATVTFWAAASLGELSDRVVTSGVLAAPGAVIERFDTVTDYLTAIPPIESWNDKGSIGLRALAEWIRACTAPSDRLLVVGWAPDLFFYAERGFAGGQVYLYPNWHSSMADQRLTVERLNRQRVPIAISPVEGEAATRTAFPIVLDHVDRHYRHVMRGNFGSALEYDVLVRRDIEPVGTYELLGLPCYR